MPPSSECAEIVAVTTQAAACFLDGFFQQKTVFETVEVAVSLVWVTACEFGSTALDVVVKIRFRDVNFHFNFMVVSEVVVDVRGCDSALGDGVDDRYKGSSSSMMRNNPGLRAVFLSLKARMKLLPLRKQTSTVLWLLSGSISTSPS